MPEAGKEAPRQQPASEKSRAEIARVAEEGQQIAEEVLSVAVTGRRRGIGPNHIFNALEFVVLFQFELNTCLKALAQARPGLEPKFHARSLVLTILESLLTMRRLLAKDFRSQLIAESMMPGLDQKLKTLHSEVNRAFEDCNLRFGEVRDGLAAHRDADPEVRLRLLERVDAEDAALLAIDTLQVLNMFHQQIVECLVPLGTPS